MSYTFTLSSRESVLSSKIYPPIILHEDEDYVLGLVNFESYNAIPNIDSSNNSFHYGENQHIKLPEGSYEISDISEYLKNYLKLNLNNSISKNKKDNEPPFLFLSANRNTLRCEIKANFEIDFTKNNSIGTLLGFKKKKLEANQKHISENPVDIFKVNSICIHCNLVSNSYNNGSSVHIIHMFYPLTPPGGKIVEKPNNVIYLPISTRYIDEIVLKITDQDGNLVNFRNEVVTARLHLKKQF